ncbi:membrane protein [Bacillus phage vB_BcgM]|nr:membrane protein [Bacillus phage vB_BcgM]
MFNLIVGVILLGCFLHHESCREDGKEKGLSLFLLFMCILNLVCGVLSL